jgi:hypothetical protein
MRLAAVILTSVSCWALSAGSSAKAADEPPDVRLFFQAAARDDREARAALEALGAAWRDDYAGMIVDLARLLPGPPRPRPVAASGGISAAAPDDERRGEDALARSGLRDAGSEPTPFAPFDSRRQRLIQFLEKQTGQRFGDDLRAWRRWIWNRPYQPHPDLLFFKAALYGSIDRRMASFFAPGGASRIRLDEVDWGGVRVNGIPPLDHPSVVAAAQARYLKDKNLVFGVALNGEARAYPKRILAWHELALDRVGGVELAVVYCTLCGTVIPYGAEAGGRRFTFGTSGLLYRSNKLMFDHETSSLWSAIEGRAVIGPLASSSLELRAHPVVTTTWDEWVKAHPETTVLSLDTGYGRDYSEGAAYSEYFATDALMFEVPHEDSRLKNKAEVLALLLPPGGAAAAAQRRPLALSVEFLKRNPIHHLTFAGQALVVVTSAAGANRVYAVAPGTRFVRRPSDATLVDAQGRSWRIAEEALVSEADGQVAPRVAARRAFWFGWSAQFPDTELIR